jgi:hypothetical protein
VTAGKRGVIPAPPLQIHRLLNGEQNPVVIPRPGGNARQELASFDPWDCFKLLFGHDHSPLVICHKG